MEVSVPSPARGFDFNSGRSSPCLTAPGTPKAFGDYYFSAPTSPSHVSQFYRDFDAWATPETAAAAGGSVPFEWEEKPGTPKSSGKDEFEFAVASEDWETASVAADVLFDGGVIKPLKLPPLMQAAAAVKSKPMSQTKRIIQGAFSPRHRSKKETAAGDIGGESEAARGRERPKSSSRRAARSLSPLREARYSWVEEAPKEPLNSSAPPAVAQGGVKKWRLMDFFLFRSASEGRAADKDPLKKYTAAVRHSSFRAGEGSGSGSGSRRKGRVSAHEVHYTVNRAASEDLKKKTFLPYKQGILGRLAFNPAVHALANGFGFSHK